MAIQGVDRKPEAALAAVDAALHDIRALSAELADQRTAAARRALASAHVHADASRKRRAHA